MGQHVFDGGPTHKIKKKTKTISRLNIQTKQKHTIKVNKIQSLNGILKHVNKSLTSFEAELQLTIIFIGY